MTAQQTALLRTIRKVMKPLVRLFVRQNVMLQSLVDMLKELYVSAAEERLEAERGKMTDSTISLMTGVHRKDVKKYRQMPADKNRAPQKLSLGAELLAGWLAHPHYIDAEGRPRALKYLDKDRPELSFSGLAESISKDVRPRALLDEFIRQDIVFFDEINNTVCLREDAFVPKEGWEEKLYYFGNNGADHLEAAARNILAQKPPFLDRSVYHDDLTEESVRELQKLATDSAMKMLRAVNRRAFELSEKDKNKSDIKHRINLGTYFFSDIKDKEE